MLFREYFHHFPRFFSRSSRPTLFGLQFSITQSAPFSINNSIYTNVYEHTQTHSRSDAIAQTTVWPSKRSSRRESTDVGKSQPMHVPPSVCQSITSGRTVNVTFTKLPVYKLNLFPFARYTLDLLYLIDRGRTFSPINVSTKSYKINLMLQIKYKYTINFIYSSH